MAYGEALLLQESLQRLRIGGGGDDFLLLVEHPPVLTLGRSGTLSNLLLSPAELSEKGVTVHEVSRGGDITYHGPGQIVGYPILDLNHHGKDIRLFIHQLEEVFVRLLKQEYGISARREEKKYTGVWAGNEKITAIGVSVRRFVTMHGFAFNVNTNLEHFKWIVPCGISDRGVTSLQKLTGSVQNMDQVKQRVIQSFCHVFGMEAVDRDLWEIQE